MQVDVIFNTTVSNGLLGQDTAAILPGWPANYAADPRKVSFLVQRSSGGSSGDIALVAGLYPRIFANHSQRMVLVTLTEVRMRTGAKTSDSVNIPKCG